MMLRISKIATSFTIILILNLLLASKVYAGTYISGHTFVSVDGSKVYLEGVDLKWKITNIPADSKWCSGFVGYSHTVKTGDPISHFFDSNGREKYIKMRKNSKGILVPVLVDSPKTPVDCAEQTMGYENSDKACIVNANGKTIDTHNNINYVFPRVGCFGCVRQTATLAVSFPDGYDGLPGDMDPNRGKWELASATALKGTATFRWDEELQILWLYDVNDADEYVNVDFEWVPNPPPTPTATPTPPPATPTPEVPASCSCLNSAIEHPDLTRVKRGDVLGFSAEAYVDTPETAKVKDMVYTITHEGSPNPIAVSDPVTAEFERVDTIEGKVVDVYKTSWSYTVKDTDPEGLYRVDVDPSCAWKTAKVRIRGEVAGSSAKADDNKEFVLLRIFRNIINSLFGRRDEGFRTQEYEAPFPTTIKPTGTSLQLGTFMPVPTLPPSGCTWVYYQIPIER